MMSVISPAVKEFYAQLPKPEKPYVSKHGSAVEKALLEGTLILIGSNIRGTINAEISKELREMGAVFQSSFGGWHLAITKIPVHIQDAARRAQETRSTWMHMLQTAIPNLAQPALVLGALGFAYRHLFREVTKSVEATTGIGLFSIPPTEPPQEFYSTVETAFTNFADAERGRLATLTLQAHDEGWPTEKLAKFLSGRSTLSEDRALRIARQAMSFAATEIKAKAYIESGLPKYRWMTKHDERVRDSHAVLDGRVFDWADPPVVNALGERRHPGQDFNCRCLAYPVSQLEALQ